jgi:hypothetical protein
LHSICPSLTLRANITLRAFDAFALRANNRFTLRTDIALRSLRTYHPRSYVVKRNDKFTAGAVALNDKIIIAYLGNLYHVLASR